MARIAFVQNIVYEYLGTEYLASALEEKGHKAELFLENNTVKLIKSLSRFKPDLIGFSCTTGIHRWAIDMARELKKALSCPTVFGGPHPTFFPEIIENNAVDIVCIGEGEHAISELAHRLDAEKDFCDVENLWVKNRVGNITKNPIRPLIENLDSLSLPDRSLYYNKYPFLNKSQKSFFAGRGCPFSCTFCFNHILKDIYKDKGPFIRLRSQQNLIDEILEVRDKFGLKTVYLQDDTILFNKIWFLEFLKIYREKVNLPFVCLVRADLMDEEITRELKMSHCHCVFFGIETGDEKLRNELLKKNIKDSQIIETAHLLKKYKIRFRTYNILGLPGEKLEQSFKTVELNIKIKTDYPWCSLFFPYPMTELGEYAKDNNLMEEDLNKFNHSFFHRSVIKLEHKNEISNLQKLFFYAVKMPVFFPLIKKAIRFKENILYDFAFLFSYAIGYFKSENLSFKDLITTARHNIRNFFFK